jgi:O-antigen/teichoic acid export membrane protein
MASVRKNFAVLMTLQISTYIVPLLTLPWLTRTLSPDGYGHLSFALAFTTYFVTFSNYGFYLTATPQIAIHRHDRMRRSKIFWTTFLAQLLIMATGFAVLLALTFIFQRLAGDRELLVIGYGMALGATLLPTWYFQGVEDLRAISGLIFAGRALSVPAMFLLVRGQGDLYWAMGVNSAVPTLSGIGVFIYLFARREIEFIRIPLGDILAVIRDGWRVFMATAVADFYASSNTVLLALISGNVAAGYFAAGDKLIRAALGMLSPLKTAAYPHISYLMHHARDDAFAFLRKMLVVQGTTVFAMSLTIFLSAPYAVRILYGPQFLPTVDVLRWMAFVPFMAGLTDVFGVQTMLPLGLKVQFSRVLLSSGVLNFALLVPLTHLFGAQGAAATVLTTETAIVIAMAYTLSLQGVALLKRRVA